MYVQYVLNVCYPVSFPWTHHSSRQGWETSQARGPKEGGAGGGEEETGAAW